MKILVAGSRDWDDYMSIFDELKIYVNNDVTLIHGDCRGADKISNEIGKLLNFKIKKYPANWKLHGKAAGPIRNREMFYSENKKNEQIDLALIFHSDIKNSKGSKDMLNIIMKENVNYKHIS